MESFEQFSLQKDHVLASLGRLRQIVEKLDAAGIDTSDVIAKLETAAKDIEGDALRIALLGAFSDGKTSVIAGWLGQIMDNMKIDTEESSDRLAIYRPDNLPEGCEIVDTPGLFGDKKHEADSDQGAVVYGEITKRYISEAHLVFYVVDATNPLKDSHKDIVRWVLRDLNKLSSTLFIINKMDEVADLRDTEDFNYQDNIKKKNLLKKLDRFLDLTQEERDNVNIVCIASNPNGRGLNFWFSKGNEYEERARIDHLKAKTSEILEDSARTVLVHKTGIDVVSDVVRQKVAAAEQEFAQFTIMADELREANQRNDEDIVQARKEVTAAKEDLLTELENYEKGLLDQIRALQKDDIQSFLEDEIGVSGDDTGYKLRMNIESICESAFEQSEASVSGVAAKIEQQLDQSEDLADTLAKSLPNMVSRMGTSVSNLPVDTIHKGVFEARDILKSTTGIAIKFKPYGAKKLATGIGKWGGRASIAIDLIGEAYDAYSKFQDENKLKKYKKDLSDSVRAHFKEVYERLDDEQKFAHRLSGMEKIAQKQREDLKALEEKKQLVLTVREELQDEARSFAPEATNIS